MRFAGLEDGIADILCFERIPEVGAGAFTFGEGGEEVGDLMNESVFITDLQTRYPPVLHVRMFAIGDVDRAPAAQPAFIAIIEVLQAVEIVQIPENGSAFAVNLKSVEGFVATRITGEFESCERTVVQTGQERAGVIDAHLFNFAGEVVFPFLNECLGHGRDGVDFAIEPNSSIDAMRQEV